MKRSEPELLLDARADLGEGPVWLEEEGRLLWVDIRAGRLHRFDPRGGQDEVVQLEAPLGCAVPAENGDILLGMKDGIARLAPGASSPSWIARPEEAVPGNRMNDGKCDPFGRLLVGSMDNAEVENRGSLYSLDPSGALRVLLSGLGISNGLAWSPDGSTFYFIDTPTRQVTAYDYDGPSGTIASPRLAVEIPPALGWPDGMCSDSMGRLWIALWGGAGLALCDPLAMRVLEVVALPAHNVTSCCFGGPDLDELFVTSARKGLGEVELGRLPRTGGLFRLRPGVEGLPTRLFG